jgi:uncharacterized protein YtpQ (UPF0354 family)
MKITKQQLKQLIKEEMANVEKAPAYEPPMDAYEMEDISTDKQMVLLLTEIIAQLKTLNHHMTPARSVGASAAEKAIASATVTERKKRS